MGSDLLEIDQDAKATVVTVPIVIQVQYHEAPLQGSASVDLSPIMALLQQIVTATIANKPCPCCGQSTTPPNGGGGR